MFLINTLLRTFVECQTDIDLNPIPWLTSQLKVLLQQRKAAHRKAMANPSDKTLLWKYRQIRRSGTLLNRRLKEHYYINLLRKNASNPRQHWAVIKTVTGMKPTVTNVQVSATQLSNFFSTTVACSSRQPLSLPEGPRLKNCLATFKKVTAPEVQTDLQHLSCVKATGSDGIPSIVLKSCSEILASSVTDLFNESLEAGEIPDIYKLAKVTPILKRGDPDNASNYRPISLLPIASKVLERIVLRRCKVYFRHHPERGLPPEQFAYRTNHSCDDLLSLVINDWHRAMDKKLVTGVVFVDVRKAFDSVSHQTLINELFSCGVTGIALQWFQSFLENRWQTVSTGNTHSSKVPCQQGVPQGSVLGPFLFSLYLRSLPDALASSQVRIRLFADDICIYFSHRDVSNIVQVLEQSLQIVVTWLSDKRLTVNCSKSEVMFVRSHRSTLPPIAVHCSGATLTPVPQVKYLGIVIDEFVTFSQQVSALHRDISAKLARFHRGRSLSCKAYSERRLVSALAYLYIADVSYQDLSN